MDLSTPIDTIYQLYNELLTPYFNIIKSKINSIYDYLIGLDDNITSKYVQSGGLNNKTVNIDKVVNTPEIVNDDSSYKGLFLFASAAFLLYYIFILPGPSINPDDLSNFNSVNQLLINSKTQIKDYAISIWDYIVNFNSVKDNNSPINPAVFDIELNQITPEINSAGSSSGTVTTPIAKAEQVNINLNPVTSQAS